MKIITYFILMTGILLIFISLRSEAADINCSDGMCSFDPSLDIRNDSNSPEFSQFEVKDLSENLAIGAPAGTSPRSTKVFIEATDPDGEDLVLNLPSTKKLNSAGSAVVIGQSIKNILVNLDGRIGDSTPNASVVCAEKILNGDYGAPVKSRYLLARFSDPALPTNACVPGDLASIQQNEFSCISGQTEFSGVSLIANRWTQRRSCDARSERRMCVKRSMRISCTWVAERLKAGAGGCSELTPGGNATLNPRPKGGGYAGIQWSCDPSIVSPIASGWRISIPPFIRDESWVQSRRLAGKTDENICDELTGRNTTYLLGFPDLTRSWARQGSSEFWASIATPDANGTIYIDRVYWAGKHSRSQINNPYVMAPAPSSSFMISATYRVCYSGGAHNWTHAISVINTRNCNATFVNNVYQPWTGYTKFGGKGHTKMIPYGVTCISEPTNSRLRCNIETTRTYEAMSWLTGQMETVTEVNNYGVIGEAFAHAHQIKWELYGPHGRKLTQYETKAVGRY